LNKEVYNTELNKRWTYLVEVGLDVTVRTALLWQRL